MTARVADTAADWLALHGVCAADLAPWTTAPAAPVSPPPDPPRAKPGPDAVLAALRAALPALAPVLDRVATEVRFDLAPDPVRFPRAFTLPDDGSGRILVSCPLADRLSDRLILAHEIGHACQFLASGPAPHPPILREAAAYTAELLLLRVDAPDRATLAPLLAARLARTGRHTPALRAALAAPASPYAYRWNYPVAAALARRASEVLPAPALATLILTPGPLAALLERLAPPP